MYQPISDEEYRRGLARYSDWEDRETLESWKREHDVCQWVMDQPGGNHEVHGVLKERFPGLGRKTKIIFTPYKKMRYRTLLGVEYDVDLVEYRSKYGFNSCLAHAPEIDTLYVFRIE
jgi:hypothetical protein